MTFDNDRSEPAADPARDEPAGDAWGWALVQADWSFRQREPGRPARAIRALWRGLVAIAVLLRRAITAITPAGDGPGTPRSSGPPSSTR
jgi:hypothetical protein